MNTFDEQAPSQGNGGAYGLPSSLPAHDRLLTSNHLRRLHYRLQHVSLSPLSFLSHVLTFPPIPPFLHLAGNTKRSVNVLPRAEDINWAPHHLATRGLGGGRIELFSDL